LRSARCDRSGGPGGHPPPPQEAASSPPDRPVSSRALAPAGEREPDTPPPSGSPASQQCSRPGPRS
jgi:hypothetical protein